VSISPTDLVPKDANGVKFKLKKVDCALFLTPHPHFHAKIKQKLMTLPDKDRSINQTSADFIKNLPLIASFELKQQSLGTDPLVQLGIWSAALAERLGRLQGQGKESELMAMPVVSIVGHDWKVYYSYTTEEGERVSFRSLLFGRLQPTNQAVHRTSRKFFCHLFPRKTGASANRGVTIDVTRARYSRIDNRFCGHFTAS
jgi:hypothetical protein